MIIAFTNPPNANLLTATGITAILALALCCWAFRMARNPNHWRCWWMSRFGMLNLNSDRELRRKQEHRLAIGSSILFLLAFAMSIYCAIWTKFTIDDIRSNTAQGKSSASKAPDLSKFKSSPTIRKPGDRFIP